MKNWEPFVFLPAYGSLQSELSTTINPHNHAVAYVRYGQDARPSVLTETHRWEQHNIDQLNLIDKQREVFVFKFCAVNGLAPSAVTTCEVTCNGQSFFPTVLMTNECIVTSPPWIINWGMIRWKTLFWKWRALPLLPTPFSPSHSEVCKCVHVCMYVCVKGMSYIWQSRASSLLTCTQRTEVLNRLGRVVAIQVNHDSASRLGSNLNIEEHLMCDGLNTWWRMVWINDKWVS